MMDLPGTTWKTNCKLKVFFSTKTKKNLFIYYFSFLFCAFQGASVVDDSQTGVLVGSFSDRRDWTGNGIKITTNGGQKWSQINGDTGGTPVRYGNV